MKTNFLLKRWAALFAFALTILAGAWPKHLMAQVDFTGDLRLRFEQDYNVTGKDDRGRLRYRFRLNAVHKSGGHLQIGARIRSGNPSDQQSPHITFGNDFNSKNFSMDKVYLKYSFNSGWIWVGKNSFPFWKQNEMFWDDDVNPEGVSVSLHTKASSSNKLSFTAGHYVVDDFNNLFNNSMIAAQAHYSGKFGSAGMNLAGGFYLFNFNDELQANDDYDPLNGMDHKIFVFGGQIRFGSNLPISFGADLMVNTDEPTMTGFEDETTGFVVQATVGRLKKTNDWLFGFYYAKIQRFSVIGNFAQDDWWRFGGGHTSSSDFKGFELRAAIQIGVKTNLVVRHYVTEMIVGDKEANRFRIDLNTKF